jgi:hypothetical protein
MYQSFTKITTSKTIQYTRNILPTNSNRTKSINSYFENFKLAYKSEDISKHAIKNLKSAIDNLIAISPKQKVFNPILKRMQEFRLTFITLTLPSEQGKYTDTEIIKEILIPFLKHAKASRMFDSYIWKAEKQKNGNIHFHITTNKFLLYNNLRNSWNKYLNRLNFIDNFEQKHGHRNPNSTDIHATYNIRNLENYLVKYMTKQEQSENKINCKSWDSSRNLKRKDKCIIEESGYMESVRNVLTKHQPKQVKILDYCTIINHTPTIEKLIFKDEVKQKFKEYQDIIKMTDRQYKEYKQIITTHQNNTNMDKLIKADENIKEQLQAYNDIRTKHLQGIKQIVTIQWKVLICGEFKTQYLKTTDLDKFFNLFAKIKISSISRITSIQAIEVKELQPNKEIFNN